MSEIYKTNDPDLNVDLKTEARELGLSEGSLKNTLQNIADELISKSQVKSFRAGFDIPISKIELECKIEGLIRKGGAKLSDLFLCFNAPNEGDTWLTLPHQMLWDLKVNLKRFDPELKDKIDTNKILVFYAYWFPKNLILDHRKFDYPLISKVSARVSKEINGKGSNLKSGSRNPN